MTAPLRRTHLRIWIVLAATLTVLIAAGIAFREDAAPRNGITWERLQ
jgi:hypothetical protein